MPAALRLELPLTVAGVAEGQAALRAFLAGAGIADRPIGHAELVLEEVLMNLLMHGFAAPEGQRVAVSAVLQAGGCRMEIEDAGWPFDPTTAAPDGPAPAASIEDAAIGGLGLVLVRRFAQDLAYQRLADGRNRLGLTVPLERAA
jgi:anti-sigma regulatory factor (Ser/Thr protein kinase)